MPLDDHRIQNSFLESIESAIIVYFCRSMPSFISSNTLTLAGIVGAATALCGFVLAHESVNWLWLVVGGITLNWFGDSLDGSLARCRKMQRNKFGFFADHMSDALSVTLIGVGIAISPFVSVVTGLLILVAYYQLMILSLVICKVTGYFPISFNRLGPTEMRFLLVLCVLAMIMLPVPTFAWGNIILTIYDVIIAVLAGLMVLTAAVQAIQIGRQLSIADPPARHPRTPANRSSTPLQ